MCIDAHIQEANLEEIGTLGAGQCENCEDERIIDEWDLVDPDEQRSMGEREEDLEPEW